MSSISDIARHREYNIQYSDSMDDYNETRPLLRDQRSNANWLFISFLFVTLCCGLIVGIYLLIKEKEWDDDEHYHPEILEDKPQLEPNSTALSKFELPLSKVLVTEIHGPPCNSSESCVRQLRKLYLEGEPTRDLCISFNFLISADGNVYENFGWDLHYTICDNNTLIVILLGKLETASLTSEQLNKLKSLLDDGARISKLAKCYSVSIRNDFGEVATNLLDFLHLLISEHNLKYNC